jgi:uncharacterized protein YndB with AHSA1/START domain
LSPPDESVEALVVRRLLPAPREQVFAAWLDPESLAQWMCPGDVASARVEIDPRVGGKLRIVMMRGEKGVEHWGEYLVIEPPARLSFSWISNYTDLIPTIVTVELLDRGLRTELVLTHRRLPDGKVEGHRQGWTDIVRKLEAALSREPAGD